jgi:hypothetical protein
MRQQTHNTARLDEVRPLSFSINNTYTKMAFPGMPGMGGMGGMGGAAGMDEEAMKQQMIIKYVRSAS